MLLMVDNANEPWLHWRWQGMARKSVMVVVEVVLVVVAVVVMFVVVDKSTDCGTYSDDDGEVKTGNDFVDYG